VKIIRQLVTRIVSLSIEWLLIVLILSAFALRSNPLQIYLAKQATDYFSKHWNTTLTLDKIDILFVNRVELKGLLLLNRSQTDTIACIESILVTMDGPSSFHKQIKLQDVQLQTGVVKVQTEHDSEQLNIQFLIDYFSKERKDTTDFMPIYAHRLRLKNMRFEFDDQRIESSDSFGMDYRHLFLSDIFLDARKVKLHRGVITAELNHLQVKEKCGFELSNFAAKKLKVSNKGINLKTFEIQTPQSSVKTTYFQLNYSSYTQFRSFVDSVSFHVDMLKSRVSMADIAYFAPQLEGMDQQVELKAKVTNVIKNLKIQHFELETGRNTRIAGDFQLPDFRSLKNKTYREKIDYALIDLYDLQEIKLPKISRVDFISLPETIRRMGYVQTRNLKMNGSLDDFYLQTDEIFTQLGSFTFDNGLSFYYAPDMESYQISSHQKMGYDLSIHQFHLGKFLSDKQFGIVEGKFDILVNAVSFSDISLDRIDGIINRCDWSGYSYTNIELHNARWIDQSLQAEGRINDPNIRLNYYTDINFKAKPTIQLSVDIQKAFPHKLNLIKTEFDQLSADITLDIVGFDINTMEGDAKIEQLIYQQGEKKVIIPQSNFRIERGDLVDRFELKSSLLNATCEGKIADFNDIKTVVTQQIHYILPELKLFSEQKIQVKNKNEATFSLELVPKHDTDCLEFVVELLDTEDFWDVFYPALSVSPKTTFKGDYDANKRFLELNILSEKVKYNNIEFNNITMRHFVENNLINASYTVQNLFLTDSIRLKNLQFEGHGNGDNFVSQVRWNPDDENNSKIQWTTQVPNPSQINFLVDQSFFAINKQKWTIEKDAHITIDAKTVEINKLKISSEQQMISINGKVTDTDQDKLNVFISELDLQKIGQMLGLDIAFMGKVNGWGYITNPYTNLNYLGDMKINNLSIDKEEVGDIYFMSQWNNKQKVIDISGDLIYRKMPTFRFEGTYDIAKKEDNIDFNLVFDQTNIAFVNAFLENLVIDQVDGYLNGQLHMTGSLSRPILEGEIYLEKAQARIVMLGTNFYMNGIMYADKDGFYIDYMPITDAEGNTGAFTGAVFHTDYTKWNVNIEINIEEDYYKKDPNQSWVRLPLERFLILNTDGTNQPLYYGKAYATGNIGIFGAFNDLEITVNARTQRGTSMNLDFFAQKDLDEDDFIVFQSQTSNLQDKEIQRTINYAGVTLNLNFDVTRDAQLRLIFNKLTGDEIIAFGEGKITLSMNRLGQLSLEGKYTTDVGSRYNFVFGPIKETFFIEEKGSVTWTGDPYHAMLNLTAYTELRANLSDMEPELLTNTNQTVNCYIHLTESLTKPTIQFEIKAPKALEQDKTLLSQITSDNDELNKQFFSLLLWKKFQPMKGSSRVSTTAALDLASNQINAILAQVSKEYQLNVSLSNDAVGHNEYALGIKKTFLDDQLIVSGTFGTRTSMTTETQSQSTLIGDIEVEYKLNKEGNLRINVFNESNDNRTLQSMNRGLAKQGIGLYYRENFDNLLDLKLLQQTIDIVRRKSRKKHPIRRKKQQIKIEDTN